MEHWKHLIDNLPFVGLMASDQRNRPYITRLFEQALPGILVGLVVAALVVWRNDTLQDEKIIVNTKRVERIETAREVSRSELNNRLETIERKIDDVRKEIKR